MKRIIILYVLSLLVLQSMGQVLTPKSLTGLQFDTYAQINSRLDEYGDKCAVIRLDVVGVKDLKFKDNVGDVLYKDNEYIVYIPKGIEEFTFFKDNESYTIVFDDYDIEIVSGATYRLILDTENKLRSAIFYVDPADAKVEVNSQPVAIDNSGKGSIELPVGRYPYSIEAEGYHSIKDTLTLLEKELFTICDLKLQEVVYPLSVSCNNKDAFLFVDDNNFGQIGLLNGNVMLPRGKHNVKVSMEGYKDYNRKINVNDKTSSLNVNLKEHKTKYNLFSHERSKTSISLRPHHDLILSGFTPMDDFMKSGIAKLNYDYHHYFGYFALKAGFNGGIGYYSDDFVEDKDIDTPENDDGESNNTFVSLGLPIQAGFALPLNKYNSSQVVFLAGAYGAYNFFIGNISQADEILEDFEEIYHFFDFGLCANVKFYFNKFILSFEGHQSLSENKLGTSVGIGLGIRFFGRKK